MLLPQPPHRSDLWAKPLTGDYQFLTSIYNVHQELPYQSEFRVSIVILLSTVF